MFDSRSESTWASSVSPAEIYLFREGTLYESYRTFGAHPVTEGGRHGRPLYRLGSECMPSRRCRRLERLEGDS
ncbi:hypothetical protein HMSSN139_30440 [Paenibacillus sp. HMSSN-139]|nr:hypothetical protein HMSSN139_30440 [Paenibacillus sp. HMSSN-139]